MGRSLRTPSCCYRLAGSPSAPRHRDSDRGGKLSPAPVCRSDPGKSPHRATRRNHLAPASTSPPAKTAADALRRRLIIPLRRGKITSPKLGKITPPLTPTVRRLRRRYEGRRWRDRTADG